MGVHAGGRGPGHLSRVTRFLGGTAFSPASLFSAGEQGFIYDLSDFERYMAPGLELVTNGGFDSGAAGWNARAGCTLSVVDGWLRLTYTGTGPARANFTTLTTVVGRTYKVSFAVRNTASTTTAGFFAYSDAFATQIGTSGAKTAAGSYEMVFTATSTTTNIEIGNSASNGGVGAYLEFDNISVRELPAISTATLYQDPAGSTPVTDVGQIVGLVLDKSQGLVLGSEVITNGDFNSSTSGWTGQGNVSLASVNGELRLTVVSSGVWAEQTIPTVAGRTYRYSATIRKGTNTICSFRIGSSQFGSQFVNVSEIYGISAIFQGVFVATGTTTFISIGGGNGTSGLTNFADNISVRELPGNHATQSVLASRPILAREPLGGRRNLLTFTQEFDNAGWTKVASSITANSATAPDGTLTADKLVATAGTAAHNINQSGGGSGAPIAFSVYAKAGTSSFIQLFHGSASTAYANFNLTTGVVGAVGARATASISPAGGGWYCCSIVFTPDAASASRIVIVSSGTAAYNESWTAAGTETIFIWGAQLETGSAATAYQRVTSTYDVTEAGKADLHYLLFDGSDDFLVTPTITPGTDKAQVFAGVRQVGNGMIVEHSSSTDVNNGAFYLYSGEVSSGDLSFVLRGSQTTKSIGGATALPVTRVTAVSFDIAGASTTMEILPRINGAAVSLARYGATDAGTGNFLAYPMYIGRRGGTTFPFNGRLYGLIARFGANLSAAQISQTEAWVNSRTGAY